MAGLLARLGALLADPGDTGPGAWQDALTVAYQQRLAWLHEIRAEAEQVAVRRRRLAVGSRPLPDPRTAAASARLDAQLAAEHRELVELGAAVRAQAEQFRAEREALLALPDQLAAAEPAREALRRWRTESELLLRAAATHTLVQHEPSGYVGDDDQPARFEQPPGAPR